MMYVRFLLLTYVQHVFHIMFFFFGFSDLAECVAQNSDAHSNRPRRKHFQLYFFFLPHTQKTI